MPTKNIKKKPKGSNGILIFLNDEVREFFLEEADLGYRPLKRHIEKVLTEYMKEVKNPSKNFKDY